MYCYLYVEVRETLMARSTGRPSSMSAEEFSNRLTGILERSLDSLSEEEQDRRIEAFENKAAKACRGTRTIASSRPQTVATPLAARSRE